MRRLSFPRALLERGGANQVRLSVYGVDESLALELHQQGVDTFEQLLSTFSEDTLSEFKRPRGAKMQRVGKAATHIMLMARAMSSGKEIVLETPKIRACQNYVIFDLEGMPPQLEDLDKVYLWGMQVFGKKPSSYLPAVASFGPDGERQGWCSSCAWQKASSPNTATFPSCTGRPTSPRTYDHRSPATEILPTA